MAGSGRDEDPELRQLLRACRIIRTLYDSSSRLFTSRPDPFPPASGPRSTRRNRRRRWRRRQRQIRAIAERVLSSCLGRPESDRSVDLPDISQLRLADPPPVEQSI
uniref:Protein Rev n=1 Tax=Simian immunodeficiency virus TaxID=11723 RepID=A0A075TCB5_SIV|nr:rev [Simian immunodeficiency virus]